MATHRVRQGIFQCKVEGTEGTWQDPIAELNAVTLHDLTYTTEPRLFDRMPYKAEFSTLPALKGGTLGTISYRVELAGSGVSAVTVPHWVTPLIPCGWQAVAPGAGALEEIPLDAEPADPLIPGEVITGGTSGETAKFIRYILDGVDEKMLVTNMSGVGQAETWTGAVSAHTATATGDATNTTLGHLVRPDSLVTSYSVMVSEPYSDTKSTAFQLKGCRGSWRIGAGNVGEPIFIDCEVKGVVHDVADVTTATAAYQDFAGIPFKGSDFFSMEFETNTGIPAANIHLNSFSIDSGGTLTPRDDANADGYTSIDITGRNIKGSFDPELVEISVTSDFWSDYDSDVQSVLSCNLGAAAGDYIDLYAGNVRYQGYGAGDRGGIRTLDMPFGVHRVGLSEDFDVLILTR